MPVDSKLVGSNERLVQILGDPTTASQYASVLAPADALSLTGLYGLLSANVLQLLNSAGTYDKMRSAVGTTGILAINSEGVKATYSAGVIAFTPAATPTDFWQIIGSATKTVRVTRLSISGLATAAASIALQLFKRTTASTDGTPAVVTIGKHDSNDGAATAVVNTFGANPSALGTSGGVIRAQKLNLGAAGAAGQCVWDFTTRNSRGLVLRGVAQQLALNWNGAAVPAGTVLEIDVEFTEE